MASLSLLWLSSPAKVCFPAVIDTFCHCHSCCCCCWNRHSHLGFVVWQSIGLHHHRGQSFCLQSFLLSWVQNLKIDCCNCQNHCSFFHLQNCFYYHHLSCLHLLRCYSCHSCHSHHSQCSGFHNPGYNFHSLCFIQSDQGHLLHNHHHYQIHYSHPH